MKKFTTLLAFTGLVFAVNAQVTDMGGPIGLNGKLSNKDIPVIEMPGFDLALAQSEDAINDANKVGPWRFGYEYITDYSLDAYGAWSDLPNGDRLWRTAIKCPGALTINLQFSDFSIPEGSYIYMYDVDQTNRVGAYTSDNINPDGLLGSELVHGEEIILEYYEPAEVAGQGDFTISMVVHGYRSGKEYTDAMLGKALNSSGDCNIDVECPLGVGWENQIRSVGMLVNGGGFCTGALINNNCDDGTGYFLTADHCGTASGSWNIRWNWKSPAGTESCATTANSVDPGPPYDQTSNGCTPAVQNGGSDFNLITINNFDITDAQSWNLFYAGWDNTDPTNYPSAVGIHHPSGDVMKICEEQNTVGQANWGGAACWHVQNWDEGVTEPGSSGSPLFDPSGRIIGQLYGGTAACSGTNDNGAPDYYGRFGVSWGLGADTYLGACGASSTNDGFDPNASTVQDDAGIQGVNVPTGLICSANFDPEVVLRNYGTDPLTSVTINYDVDAGPNQVYNWTGNLAPGATTTVFLPTMSSTSGAHTFNASTDMPNGNVDPNTGNDGSNSTFSLQTNGQPITLTLNLDCWGSEIDWEIQDSGNNTVISGGPYTDQGGGEQIVVNTCLDPGCYDFIINDSYGDGLYGSQYPGCTIDGDYTIEDGSSNVLATIQAANGDFGNQEINNFCVNPPCNGTVTSSSTNVSCFGANDGSITVDLSGGDNPITYDIGGGPQSSGAFTGLGGGNYTVTIIDNSACTQTVNITVNEPAAITDSYSVTDEMTGGDGAIDLTISGGTPPFTYSWTGPNSFTSSVEDPSGLEQGSYSVSVTDANGCTHDVTGINVGSQVSINEISILFNIFPNPSNGLFNVQLLNTDEDVTVAILDVTGRLIYEQQVVGKSVFTIDISDRAEGTYFLRISDGDKQTSQPIINHK